MRLRLESFVLMILATMGAGMALVVAQRGLADFGLSENDLKPRIVGALMYGNMPIYPNRKLYQAAKPAGQAAFVKNALGWVKSYTESAAFQAD